MSQNSTRSLQKNKLISTIPENWIEGVVLHGDQTGRTINFPTVNLDVSLFPKNLQEGIYASRVKILNSQDAVGAVHLGALYFGPRLVKNETQNVLEIHILDFDEEIYGQNISFCVGKFIRGVMNFSSLDELHEQIRKDVEEVRNSI